MTTANKNITVYTVIATRKMRGGEGRERKGRGREGREGREEGGKGRERKGRGKRTCINFP